MIILLCFTYSPAFGGEDCEGESREYEACNNDVCSVYYIVFSCHTLFTIYSHAQRELLTSEMCSVQLLMACHLMDDFMHGNLSVAHVRSYLY